MDKNFDYKSILGISLFVISVLIGIYMFVVPCSHVFIHIDELWSAALVRSSFLDCINITINDVHPPLYYLILKIFCEILNVMNVNYEFVYVLHAVSALSYFGVLLVSATKIRRQYGWLTAGIFTFALASMSEFFLLFLRIRMQGWGLFFLVMSFVYFRDIIEKSDRKSWALFVLFTILGCYTHYILLISYGLMYLALLIHAIKNKESRKVEVKKWIIAAAATLVLYLPWLFVIYEQMKKTTDYSQAVIPSKMELFDYFGWITTAGTDSTAFAFKILTVLFVLFVIAIFIKQYKRNSDADNFYIASGFFIYIFTFILSIILLVSTYKSLNIRYMLPVISILWLAIAIIIGKVESKRIVVISVVMILILAVGAMSEMANETDTLYRVGSKEMKILDDLNSSDNVVVFSKDFMCVCYHDYLTNASLYCLENFTVDYKMDDVKYSELVGPIVKENPDKDMYMIKLNKYKNAKFDSNLTGKTFFSRGNTRFIEIH